MTHFVVMVIGNDWEKQLAPFHQFECTGINDEYVIDIDETETHLNEYNTETQSMMKNLATGKVLSKYNEQFYRPATAEELAVNSFRNEVHFVPEGWEEITMVHKDIYSFKEYLKDHCGKTVFIRDSKNLILDLTGKHKYGHVLIDKDDNVLKVINRTNPNYKWDWYEMGGRWSGKLRMKHGAIGHRNINTGISKDVSPGYVDQARAGDIDWESLKKEAAQKAGEYWDKIKDIAPNMWISFEDVKNKFPEDIEAAREFYWKQPGRVALSKVKGMFSVGDDVLVSRKKYMLKAYNSAGLARAFIKDGQWVEQGEAGWFGFFNDTMSSDEWYSKMYDIVKDLPEDTLITMVDCHV